MEQTNPSKKSRSPAAVLTLAALFSVLSILRLHEDGLNSWGGVDLLGIFVLCGTVWGLHLLPLPPVDYVLLAPALTFLIFSLPHARFNIAAELLLVLFCDAILVFWETWEFRRWGVALAVTVLTCAVVLWVYYLYFANILSLYYAYFRLSHWMLKGAILFCLSVVFMALVLMLLYLVGRIFKRQMGSALFLSEKYLDVELFILLLLVSTLIFFSILSIMQLPTSMMQQYHSLFFLVMIFIVILQILYIRLVFKTISLREQMQLSEDDRRSLSLYNQDLEQSLENLRAVRHDVKNLFLTMGGFVERSGDEEMKQFWRGNILPFVDDTMQKSDIQIRLSSLRDEALKSFLYYKIIEGMQRGLDMVLEVALSEETPFFDFSVERTDLVRLLGIFLDNAMEEARVAEGTVSLKIEETDEVVSFTVRNGTREETRRHGVVAGTTDKGLGRGNGLIIAGKILAKYDNLVLNSYFAEEDFVQQLVVLKPSRRGGRTMADRWRRK